MKEEPMTTETAETSASKTYPCPSCERVFTSPYALLGHQKRHSAGRQAPKIYTCPDCGFQDSLPQRYAQHRRFCPIRRTVADVRGDMNLPMMGNTVSNTVDVHISQFDDSMVGWVQWYLDLWDEEGTDEIERDIAVLRRLMDRERDLRGQ